MADCSLRREPRPGESGAGAAHSCARRLVQPPLTACVQPFTLRDGRSAYGAGHPANFHGQEFLEAKQWDVPANSPNLLEWGALESGTDQAMVNHLRFTKDLIRLRWNHPALRGDNVSPFHVNDGNRVIAFHRWIEGTGQDVVVVATLSETTWYDYAVGFPFAGQWTEVFNSDVYDNFVNPIVAGNGGGITASGPPMHGLASSAQIVIPANGFVVFARG